MTGNAWSVLAGALTLALAMGTQARAADDTSRNNAAATERSSCADPCQACMKSIETGATDESCPKACATCDEQRRARTQVKAGQASGERAAGADVRASLDQVGSNISKAAGNAASDVGRNVDQARQSGMSARRGFGAGGYNQTLITDVVGTFSGQGLNVEYQRPMAERISGIVGGNYSRTASTTGSITNFGAEAGLDYFPFGAAGEGFRVGPRVGLQMGQESVDNSRFFTDFGLGGELGYNWVGSSGLSLQVAGGLGGKVGGALTSGLDTRLSGDFGPYGKVNVGWSW